MFKSRLPIFIYMIDLLSAAPKSNKSPEGDFSTLTSKKKFLPMFSKNISFPAAEEDVIKYWKENDSFNESKELSKDRKKFIFYDGPPFATGLPHYGHILSGAIKDVVGRYKYQQGYRVDRRFGWDCHGLPVEYEIDKKLKITDRRQVLEMGIDKYNDECKSIVMKYSNEWEQTVTRMGRWIDFEGGYRTMDKSCMETCWYIFKQLFDRNKIYRGYKVMPFSTACKTPLSNFEANQNYKDSSDPSIIVSFPLIEKFEGLKVEVLIWTTTPWTLPANCALIINSCFTYAICEINGKNYIIHENRVKEYFKTFKIKKRVSGSSLLGLGYIPLFDFYEGLREKGFFRIIAADYVSDQNGTSIVHCAPAFGEDDYKAFVNAKIIDENQEAPCPIDENGMFRFATITEFKTCNYEAPVVSIETARERYEGVYFKDLDKLVLQDIKDRLLMNNRIVHSYPFCWRSDTPLIYRLVPNWFIKVKDSRDILLKNNDMINWVPEDVKFKRFHNWLEQAKDWAVGRNRFWGTPIPIWVTEDFSEYICVGSIAELESLSGVKVDDLHRQFVDKIVIKKNNKVFRRVDEVLDCWFESGSMPYSQDHWPFCEMDGNQCKCDSCKLQLSKNSSQNSSSNENCNSFQDIKNRLEKVSLEKESGLLHKSEFPADFIGEGIDQTRGWFYTLHVIGSLLFDKPAFKNVICFGIVLAEDGKKMSKRLQNYPDPHEIFKRHGADALRMYLISSPVVVAENLRFSENGVIEVVKTLLIPWYNSLGFFKDCKSSVTSDISLSSTVNLDSTEMDEWIRCSFNNFVYSTTETMNNYKLNVVLEKALRFIDDLSNWYIRMNRKQLRNDGTLLGILLRDFSIAMAPFTPFFSEYCYQSICPGSSVHHCMYPSSTKGKHPFDQAKRVIEAIRQMRENKVLKLKRPLKQVVIVCNDGLKAVLSQFNDVIQSECNILELKFSSESNYTFSITVKPFFENLKKDPSTMKSKMASIKKITNDNAIDLMVKSVMVDGVLIENSDVLVDKQFENVDNALMFGDFGIILDLTIDSQVEEMSEAREFFSFIQKMRKSFGLVVSDKVNVDLDSDKLKEITSRYYPEIIFGTSGNAVGESEYSYSESPIKVKLLKLN